MRAHLLALALLALPTFATAQPRPPEATPAPGAKAAAPPDAPPSGSTPRVRGPGPFRVPGDLPRPARVIAIELHGEVTRGMAAFVERVTGSLESGDLLLLDIKTFGGRVDAAVTIRDALLHTRDVGARTVAYVNPRAISAGALIAYATDVIVVAPGATMGAATPVQLGQDGEAKAVEDKVVSYMRQEMRATALARGRKGELAEAMVDSDVEVPGLIAKGKLLTLDGGAALEWGVASFEAASRDALLKQLGYGALGRTHKLRVVKALLAEELAAWLSSAAVSSLLMTIGMLGLMIGLYSGGSPVPLVAGAGCLLLFFFGHYLTRLAGLEELLLFLLGVSLIAVEVFVAGTILPGVFGILCIVAALALGLLDFERVPLHVQWESGLIGSALAVVCGSLLAAVVLVAIALHLLPRSSLGKPLVLAEALEGRVTAPAAAEAAARLVGQVGSAATDLRPAGKVMLAGRRHDARAQVGFVGAGSAIEVVQVRGLELVVRALPTAPAPIERSALSEDGVA